MHDWKAAFAKPLYVPVREIWEPYVYRRPDGTAATVCGSNIAILVAPGEHSVLIADGYNSQMISVVVAPALRRASGKSIDHMLNAGTVLLGTTTVETLRKLAGKPLSPPDPAEVKCEECGGRGEVECYACGHEHECDHCDGTGKREGYAPDPDPDFIQIGSELIDTQMLAPLVDRVPDGPVTVSTYKVGTAVRFHLVGRGWRIVVQALQAGSEPEEGERRPLPLSPNDDDCVQPYVRDRSIHPDVAGG